MSEWKPGDVVTFGASSPVLRTRTGWAYPDGSVGGLHQDAYDSKRPLVVIDPADAEQVERLADALSCARAGHKMANAYPKEIADLAAALREFAAPTPPKPSEPQGLGAVVEDAEGRRYIRCTEGDARWHCPDDDSGKHDDYYSDIAAVRVLSEGVS